MILEIMLRREVLVLRTREGGVVSIELETLEPWNF